MKWLCTVSLFLFVFNASADVSQNEVGGMLDKMVKEGTISALEAEKTKAKMNAMNGNEWSALNNQAEKVAASRGPASISAANPIKEPKTFDLDKAQLNQIEDDIKKIIPEQHH